MNPTDAAIERVRETRRRLVASCDGDAHNLARAMHQMSWVIVQGIEPGDAVNDRTPSLSGYPALARHPWPASAPTISTMIQTLNTPQIQSDPDSLGAEFWTEFHLLLTLERHRACQPVNSYK